jgi:hypothetical protein
VSDLSLKVGVQLTAAEPGGNDKPLAKPVAAALFIRPVASVRPALSTEDFLPFAPVLASGELDSGLSTTGFEGVEPSPLVAVSVPEPVVKIGPVERPILEVKPSAAPIAVYEPMQFLDYEDDDDSFSEPEPEFEPPAPLMALLAVAIPQAASPGQAKRQQGFAPIAFTDTSVEMPEVSLTTARRKLIHGPNPFAPKPQAVPAPQVEVQTATAPPPTPAPLSRPAQVINKPAAAKQTQSQPNVQRPAAAAAAAATAPAIKAEPGPARPEPSRQDKDKRPNFKAAPPPPANRPVRDRSNAVPTEEIIPETPAPALKPKMVPIRKPEPLTPAATLSDVPMMGMSQGEKSGGPKIAIAAAAVIVLAGGGYFLFSGSKSTTGGGQFAAEAGSEISAPGMIIGGGGWTTTWGAEAPINKGKQIAIYRPSMAMTDYRFEFFGQIERKAMGWIFRASNPKNYYVMKLETIKPGASPLVALVKYAVIDGKETTRTQVMLPFDVKAGTVYQVRLDVRGDKFTTHVQGKLVDYWSDDRIKVGGAGFYTDTAERAQIKSSQVSYLK